jgi:hypothetical protein
MKFIITKSQLNEYIERKKAKKVYETIMEDIEKNMKYLNESISLKTINQNTIDNYKRKNLISPRVFRLLVNNKIINENYEIL